MNPIVKSIVTVVAVVAAYKGVSTYASIQIARGIAACSRESPPHFRSEEEGRRYASAIFDCVEDRNDFITARFFNKQHFLDSVTFTRAKN